MRRHKTLMSKKYYSMLLGGTLTMMVVSMLLMSDSIIAGVVVGSEAVAGITLVTPLYSLAAFFGSIFSLGVPIIYSTEMGKFNKKEADRAFGFGLAMSIGVSIILFLGITLLGDMYLRSSEPTETVLEQAKEYLFWMRFTILLLPFQMLLAEAVYNDGDETVSTVANIVQGLGNIITSIVLSHFMGVRGIALASFAFNIVALVILFTHFLKKNNSLCLNLYFSFSILKRVIRYSIIDSSTYLFLAILTAVLNAFVSCRFGAEYIILVSVVALIRELQLVFDGIGEALTPIITVYLGEENPKGVKITYSLALKIALVEGMIVTAILILCAPFIPGILDITEPEMVRVSTVCIRIIALGSVFMSLLYLLTSYYLLIEKIVLGVVASAFRDVVLSVLLAVVLGSVFGMNGMFAGLAAAPAASYGLLIVYIAMRYGRENCPIFLERLPSAGRSELFNIEVEPEQIIGLQKKVEKMLIDDGLDHRTVGRAKLLIEELYMLIREKNDEKYILSECSVILRQDGVQIITKDDGVIFDISEDDVNVTSIAAYAVSSYMEKLGENRKYLTTMSFNRSSFLIRATAKEEKTI